MVEANVPPFSKEDEREATQAFIDNINEVMRQKWVKSQNLLRVTLDEVAEQDREVAENFQCSVCLHIVELDTAVKCDQCDQIYEKECLEKSL